MRRHYLTMLLLAGVHISLSATPLSSDTTDHLTLAQQYRAQGDRTQAIEHYQSARADFTQIQDYSNLIYVFTQLAFLYTADTDTYSQAKTYLDSAQLILEDKSLKNDTLAALIWYEKAKLARAQREQYVAIEFFKKSLELKAKFYGEDHLEVADNLEQIGRVYLYNLQNPYASEPYHEQALKIREQLNHEDRSYVNCFYHLAVANRMQYDYEKALAYGVKALEGYKRLPETDFADLMIANSALSHTYYSMDSIESALEYSGRALSMAVQGDLLLFMDMALHYNNQAELHFRAKAFDSTIYYVQKALSYQPASVTLANSYQYLANAYREQERLSLAFQYYQKSKELKESALKGQHTQLVTLYVDLGQAFAADHQVDSALHYYRKALVSAKISQQTATKSANVSIQVGDDLAAVEEVLENIIDLLNEQYHHTHDPKYLTQALPYYMLFDQSMDLSRTNYSSEGSKLLQSGKYKSIYEQAIASCYELYQHNQSDSLLRQVFHFMEKSKAMVLLESIHQAEANQSILPDSLVRQYHSLQAQRAYCQSGLIDARRNTSNSFTVREWQQQKADILRKIDALRRNIQVHYPNYYNVAYSEITVQLDSIQGYLAPHQPMASYFWGDSAVYVLMITSNDVKMHRVKNVFALKNAISQYQDALVNDRVEDPSYVNFLQFQVGAHTLYQTLLEPILPDYAIEHLTVVPDGELTTIPFEGFITSMIETSRNDIRYQALPYLIKQYDISYEYSLSIAFGGKRNRETERDNEELVVIAFGIKNFDKLPGGQQYPRLGGAEREVHYIQKKFPEAQVFLNTNATEIQFKQHAPEADLLHVATHGIANLNNPFASQFIFYPEGAEDGKLHLYELYNIPLKAKVLLLTACESGVGKHYAGEGNFSLARSFVYAGCKSVVMSLWQINDIITEQMIKGIYDQLKNQQTTSKSLQNIKIALIEGGTYAHPQCWAGMVPLGNVSLEYHEQNYTKYVIAILMVLVLGAILLRHKLRSFTSDRDVIHS
ncbi:MAG: CHAT domain-containing tetratricopeptide repeat protein [Bacteroidota bacterium]